jgi:tetratricopeptide (TPR) repeat protein
MSWTPILQYKSTSPMCSSLCRYGIGQIYYRQEKYEMAINNFRHALNINASSAVLMCYLGMAYHKQGRISEAMSALADAIRSDDQNPLARYEYAAVLISQDRLHEAIVELEKLKVSFSFLTVADFELGTLASPYTY